MVDLRQQLRVHRKTAIQLVARLGAQTLRELALRDIEDYVSNLYPFFKAEMHLPWAEQDLTAIVKDLADFLTLDE